ncbi:hypothetical protein E2C01_042743 [Portunus trituberculatus]|uniref:Uncharacterized protein n=1 Tax=Portunus trituberculatus TaxID=210409 RepID=A0A5B7FTU9_PORTR|nr:hypothetical protein [Portunus trituberculatus]
MSFCFFISCISSFNPLLIALTFSHSTNLNFSSIFSVVSPFYVDQPSHTTYFVPESRKILVHNILIVRLAALLCYISLLFFFP